MQPSTNSRPTIISQGPAPCMYRTVPAARAPPDSAPSSGQGLGSTRWKGCLGPAAADPWGVPVDELVCAMKLPQEREAAAAGWPVAAGPADEAGLATGSCVFARNMV